MSNREALAAALEWVDRYEPSRTEAIITGAAKERLSQLAERCGTCDGCGKIYSAWAPLNKATCPTCHGSGKVYPAELVELIASVIHRGVFGVLDALNGET